MRVEVKRTATPTSYTKSFIDLHIITEYEVTLHRWFKKAETFLVEQHLHTYPEFYMRYYRVDTRTRVPLPLAERIRAAKVIGE